MQVQTNMQFSDIEYIIDDIYNYYNSSTESEFKQRNINHIISIYADENKNNCSVLIPGEVTTTLHNEKVIFEDSNGQICNIGSFGVQLNELMYEYCNCSKEYQKEMIREFIKNKTKNVLEDIEEYIEKSSYSI